MVPVTAITMMNAVIASPVQRWSHKILFRNMSCLSGMGVPFDVNETCRKVTGGFATGWGAGRKAKPTRLKTAEFSTGSMRTSTSVSIADGLVHHGPREFRRASTQKEGAGRSAGQVEGGCGWKS